MRILRVCNCIWVVMYLTLNYLQQFLTNVSRGTFNVILTININIVQRNAINVLYNYEVNSFPKGYQRIFLIIKKEG